MQADSEGNLPVQALLKQQELMEASRCYLHKVSLGTSASSDSLDAHHVGSLKASMLPATC